MKNRKFTIEIGVSFDGGAPEHEGYYNSPDEAKEAIDQLYEMFEENYDEDKEFKTPCIHFDKDKGITPRCVCLLEDGYCRKKICK